MAKNNAIQRIYRLRNSCIQYCSAEPELVLAISAIPLELKAKQLIRQRDGDILPNDRDRKKFACEPGQSYKLEITDLNHRGEGVGKVSGFTLFVPGALPGEIVEALITKTHQNYAETTLLSKISSSPYLVKPPCPYFNACGGCQLQHLQYDKQLAWKHNMVTETLRRIAGVEPVIKPPLGMDNPWCYRNKAQIHLGLKKGSITAGFYETKSRRIINIEECLVQHPSNSRAINAIRRALQQYIGKENLTTPGNLPITGAAIRASFTKTECLVTLGGSEKNGRPKDENLKKLAELINAETGNQTTGVVFQQGGKKGICDLTLFGQSYIEEDIAPFRYRISPQSFFQVNSAQAAVLYEQAASMAGSPKSAYDLYCGTGNFSLYLSMKANQVIGIDSSRAAIADARVNASVNSVENIKFIKARTEDISDLLLAGSHPKTIFLNPPRKGCSKNLLDTVAEAKPERIVYISCNPATLARDLKHLHQYNYSVTLVQPVDMFPHTSHIETITLLQNKFNIWGQA